MLLRRQSTIDIKTLKLVRVLDELALLSEEGIDEFCEADEDSICEQLYYDEQNPDADGLYPVVRDYNDENPDELEIVSYYGEGQDDYKVRAVVEEDLTYILVTFSDSDEQIAIEDGVWDFLE
ncbi:MAG: hypothetical protein KBS81_04580 [Spirochaetales bacterium]|nr:hypothetical protein [Candidatus Physcosoma equi]